MTWTLHHGDFRKIPLPTPKPGQRVIACMDPPYSPRTHVGRRTGSSSDGYRKLTGKSHAGGGHVAEIKYAPLTLPLVRQTIKRVLKLHPEWVLFFGDITGDGKGTIPWWGSELDKAGFYTFSPKPWCKPDAAPRKSGEGPDDAVEWVQVGDGDAELTTDDLRRIADEIDAGELQDNDRLLIARHMKRIRRYGSRDGFFHEPTASTRGRNGKANPTPGKKPLGLMKKVLAQYVEPGDLVIDFFAGECTTLEAAEELGCDSWGCEIDLATYRRGRKRLEAMSAQVLLPGVVRHRPSQVDVVKTAKWDVKREVGQ